MLTMTPQTQIIPIATLRSLQLSARESMNHRYACVKKSLKKFTTEGTENTEIKQLYSLLCVLCVLCGYFSLLRFCEDGMRDARVDTRIARASSVPSSDHERSPAASLVGVCSVGAIAAAPTSRCNACLCQLSAAPAISRRNAAQTIVGANCRAPVATPRAV